jgi:nucleoside-diphosphate-sugar epimerase
MKNALASDLDHVLKHTEGIWEDIRGKNLFITGGTGFFGCWLLESFVWANDKLGLDASALVLTRNPDAFNRKAPHLANHPAIKFHVGDVRSFEFPVGTFSHVIHAATEASAKLNTENPALMIDTIISGTQHTLDFARYSGAKKFLLTSSGAVYGKQPPELTHIQEDYIGGLDTMNPGSAYGEGKRVAELLCTIYAKQFGFEAKIARCFAFVGPYLPLNEHFAIGNFIRDGIKGHPIYVNGDGTPYRSYLCSADLAIWLWTILCKGKDCYPYNVGSEHDVTIADLANMVAGSFQPTAEVQIAKKSTPGKSPERYIPSTKRAFIELNLRQTIGLQESVERTILWNKSII